LVKIVLLVTWVFITSPAQTVKDLKQPSLSNAEISNIKQWKTYSLACLGTELAQTGLSPASDQISENNSKAPEIRI